MTPNLILIISLSTFVVLVITAIVLWVRNYITMPPEKIKPIYLNMNSTYKGFNTTDIAYEETNKLQL